jgi:hypothetical protein
MAAAGAELERLSERYYRFAIEEARGSSESYERLASGVAASPSILVFLATLPTDRQQPNLFLAAVRHLFGVPHSVGHLADVVDNHGDRIREVMLSRTTQTNEPGRCAVLLPLLARLPQPLALIEVGASAGLCLLPDRYGYTYGPVQLEPVIRGRTPHPVFPCQVNGNTPAPTGLPAVAWRAGLDVNPIDLQSTEDAAWLETLVWPGQAARAARLRAALEIARADPPPVMRGNLLSDLEPLMASAPQDATLVVFHTAVLSYVPEAAERARFAQMMLNSGAIWISNESPRVFASIAEKAPPPSAVGRFLLSINGQPVAWTGPHGQSIDWFEHL